jgi:SPP1 gp7 family putative phage head morphogenesis protein
MHEIYFKGCMHTLGDEPSKKGKKIKHKTINDAYEALHKSKKATAKLLKQPKVAALVRETAAYFNEGLAIGIKDNEVPEKMLKALQDNVYYFSALKTHAQLKEASTLLLNKNGEIKPFKTFLNDVKNIDKQYNENYLEAEYSFAIDSATAAAKWQSYVEDADRYNLQYRTANDSKVRASHQTLNNITLPITDGFWNSYYPPNGWRCRCRAVRVLKDSFEQSNSADAQKLGEKATTAIGADGKNKLEMFRFNPGKQQVIFPPKHPYSRVAGAKNIKP